MSAKDVVFALVHLLICSNALKNLWRNSRVSPRIVNNTLDLGVIYVIQKVLLCSTKDNLTALLQWCLATSLVCRTTNEHQAI